jgi:hypothetical protein
MDEIEKIKAELGRVDAKVAAVTPEARRVQVDAIWKALAAKGVVPSAQDVSMAERYIDGSMAFDVFAHQIYNRFGGSL